MNFLFGFVLNGLQVSLLHLWFSQGNRKQNLPSVKVIFSSGKVTPGRAKLNKLLERKYSSAGENSKHLTTDPKHALESFPQPPSKKW